MRLHFLLLLLPLLTSAPAPPSDVDDLVAAQLVAAAAGAYADAGVDPRARFRHVRGACGRGVGACVLGHCCSSRGTCGLSPWACGPLCQPAFSGRGSPCRGGGVPQPPPPASLPVAAGPGAPCGAYVATCPDHTCCTRLGACALAGSGLCFSRGGGDNTTSLTRRHRLVAYHARVAPDGVERVAAVVNGRTPGPVIVVDAGDAAVVEFVNALPAPSSLHWHGVRVGADAAPGGGLGVASDGAAGVTQRPVAAAVDGAASAAAGPPVFVYDVAPTDPGTYWWHAHSGVQYVDGLRGALVVRGEADRRRPADAAVFVADWYRAPAAAFLPKLAGPGNPLGNEPVPSSVTINGVASDGGSCVNGTAATPCPPPPPVVRSAPAACSSTTPLPLLRFINGGAMAPVAVHVVRPGGPRLHTFVVAADGVPTARTRVPGPLRLAVGQRLDVEVCSAGGGDEPTIAAPAWLVAVMDSSRFDAAPSAPASLAILDFDGSGTPPAAPPAYDADAKGYLPPLPPPGGAALAPPPRGADVTHTLAIESKVDGAGASAYYVNGVSHRPDLVDGRAASMPSLLERLTANPENVPPPRDPPPPAAAAAPGAAPPRDARAGWHVVRVPRGSVVDLVFNNRDAGNDHPMHVHGLPFWVLNAGVEGAGDFVPADESPAPPTPLVARDTAVVAPASHLRVRLVAAAPGPWYVHCHVAWHEATGLAVVLVVE